MKHFLNNCLKIRLPALSQACLLCGAASKHTAICDACDAEQPRLPAARCAVCALPVPGGGTCGACLDHMPHFDRVTATFVYGFPLDALIHAFKYGNNLAIAGALGAALAKSVAGECPDCIVPMPLSLERLRSRGFNQALEIARCVSSFTGIPIAAAACRKVMDTRPQAALPWKERARNVRGAYVCDADFEQARVAVVDDVMTTGATLNELARILKRAGAAEVRGWMVARALKQ